MHVPVLPDEAVSYLAPKPGGRYLDCTLGAGGHAAAILEASAPHGRLLGLDADADALSLARERLAPYRDRVRFVHASFADLAHHVRANGFEPLDGVLFDLGVSSMQLDRAERGFSFQSEAPLDMRLDRSMGVTAADLVRDLDARELERVIRDYGEEPRARAVARAIVAARVRRPITTTTELAELIRRVVPGGRVNPATRTFQALRIAVNGELDALRAGLRQAHEVIAEGGRLVAISFHSLEDRIVKQYFASQANPCVCPPSLPKCVCGREPALQVLTRKVVIPSNAEVGRNPRSRSAKLRAAVKLAAPV